jgi:hypothetical protein
MPRVQLRSRTAAALVVSAALATAGIVATVWSMRRAPAEVQTLKAVLQRLRQGNNLGDQPVQFMVASGTYTAHLAAQRGLCKPDKCDLFAQLNPYQRYGNGWDELIRQGYALGDIQAWSASSGTVVIPRAAFRAYGSHTGFLACTIAHEIAHIRRHHLFQQSYYLNHKLRGQSEEAKKIGDRKRSRELELEADRDAATMLVRAGFPARQCEQDLAFMARSIGDASITEPDSTHPGYEERLSAIRAHYDAIEKQAPTAEVSSRLSFSYNRNNNLLTMTPRPR